MGLPPQSFKRRLGLTSSFSGWGMKVILEETFLMPSHHKTRHAVVSSAVVDEKAMRWEQGCVSWLRNRNKIVVKRELKIKITQFSFQGNLQSNVLVRQCFIAVVS